MAARSPATGRGWSSGVKRSDIGGHFVPVPRHFNAAVLTMPAQAGKLSPDDDVRSWLTEPPESDQTIALRHMLHQTSGLRDYLNLSILRRWLT